MLASGAGTALLTGGKCSPNTIHWIVHGAHRFDSVHHQIHDDLLQRAIRFLIRQ
jgi:hypothetical protein